MSTAGETFYFVVVGICSYFWLHNAWDAGLGIIHDWKLGNLPKADNVGKLFWYAGVCPFVMYKMRPSEEKKSE